MGKTILAALASALTGFLAGGLIYGLLLAEFMKSAMVQHEGVYKEPMELWAIGIANISLGFLLVWLFQSMSVKKFSKGLLKGLIIGFLITIWFDSLIHAMMYIYNSVGGFVVDVIASTVIGGLMGGVAALILGIGNKAE